MKVCFNQFLGQNHSWSLVGQNIARSLVKMGHDVHLCSTNGYDKFPKDLEPNKKEVLASKYDLQISYTAMINFKNYLSYGRKNRFGIWNYETTILPTGFAKHYQYTDKMLPSSEFSKIVFKENGIPEDKMVVVPHGINSEEFSDKSVYSLQTKKRYKILANIAQPHIRKNIAGLFESYGKAFTKDDDVCLVIKINLQKEKSTRHVFDVDFMRLYNNFLSDFKNHAEVELVKEFLPSMVPLYNACDIVFSTTHAECFWLPGLEGMAAKKVIVAPNWGGQLEYMNDSNSLLIEGKEVRAPRALQYWTSSPYARTFSPAIDDAVDKLRFAVNNYDSVLEQFKPGIEEQVSRLTWDNVAKQILDLTE